MGVASAAGANAPASTSAPHECAMTPNSQSFVTVLDKHPKMAKCAQCRGPAIPDRRSAATGLVIEYKRAPFSHRHQRSDQIGMIEARPTVNNVHGGTPSNLANKCRPSRRIDNRAVPGRRGGTASHHRGVTEKYPAPKLKRASGGTFWISSLG